MTPKTGAGAAAVSVYRERADGRQSRLVAEGRRPPLSWYQRQAVRNALLAELVYRDGLYIVDAAAILAMSERQARRRLRAMSDLERRGRPCRGRAR
jgi:hypothetical protein